MSILRPMLRRIFLRGDRLVLLVAFIVCAVIFLATGSGVTADPRTNGMKLLSESSLTFDTTATVSKNFPLSLEVLGDPDDGAIKKACKTYTMNCEPGSLLVSLYGGGTINVLLSNGKVDAGAIVIFSPNRIRQLVKTSDRPFALTVRDWSGRKSDKCDPIRTVREIQGSAYETLFTLYIETTLSACDRGATLDGGEGWPLLNVSVDLVTR